MKNSLKLIDNSSSQYQLGEVFRELIKDSSYSQISIASGYWDLQGMVEIYDALKTFLERENTCFRLLLGEEPSVKSYQVKEPIKQDPDFPEKYLKKDLENLQLKEEFQKVTDLLRKYMDFENKSKISIKVYRKNFLHAKCYIIGSEVENAIGIIGSSNFTKKGLFGNLELNAFENDGRIVNYKRLNESQQPSHRSWFETLWDESEDWSGFFKEEILELSKHGNVCYSPYEMYIHGLYRIYGQDLDDEKEGKVFNENPNAPQLHPFQIRNANMLIKKLDRQKVAMLSDSVGLGKTITAIKVIEYYKQSPKDNNRVVVICPASLKNQWRSEFASFGIVHQEIYSLQDTNEIKNIKSIYRFLPVGLFVFDESHNLRSSGGERFKIFTDWRLENKNSKTLLLTATPINNQLHDLTNQFILGTGGNVEPIGTFFDPLHQRRYYIKEHFDTIQKEMKKEAKERSGLVDYLKYKERLTPFLNKIMVKRTRQGIEKEYPEGLFINGKIHKFPTSIPKNLDYQVSNDYLQELLRLSNSYTQLYTAYDYEVISLANLEYLAHPLDLLEKCEKRNDTVTSSLEIIYTGILTLGFPCYRYHIYRHSYYNKKRKELKLDSEQNIELSRQIGIYGIFRTIFLKRLESSLYSIQLSLNNYEKKLLEFQKHLLESKKIVSVKNQKLLNDWLKLYNEESAEEDTIDFDLAQLEMEEQGFIAIDADTGIFKIEQLINDLEKDFNIIQIVKKQLALLMENDHKLGVLMDTLNSNCNQKVLVFTYFADTLKYLRDHVKDNLQKKINAEFALGNKNEVENFANRFAPRSKKYTLNPGEKEIDILFATDKLSEGQNLQDCGIIINYDLHWNPVRMIQRNGRINRLGTDFSEIYVYNFRPVEQLESYLKLIEKLKEKINLIRYTIGSDQSVLDEEPIPQEFTVDLYSNDEKKRIEALKRIFDYSDFNVADDIFLDELRMFDRNDSFSSEYKTQIRNMPKGKWGFVKNKKEGEEYKYLGHLTGEDQTSYFVTFNQQLQGTLLTGSEGLLRIQVGSEENHRFKDSFKNKPETETGIKKFIEMEIFEGEILLNTFSEKQKNDIHQLYTTMQQYGKPIEDFQTLQNCFEKCQNAYINMQLKDLLKKLAIVIRKKDIISLEMVDEFIRLSKLFDPGLKPEPIKLNEIIQIFVR